MKTSLQEKLAVLFVIGFLVGLPAAVWLYDQHLLASRNEGVDRVFELTGVHDVGIWTTQNVSGWNYWWREVQPPLPLEVNVGERVLIRLRSADVTHSFGIPQLKVGPAEIDPGHVKEIHLRVEEPGTFRFLCYTVCGARHQNMKGDLVVHGEEEETDLGGL